MASPFLGLRTCIYNVTDINKAKAWYGNVFATEPYFDEPFYVGFNIGGYELGLIPDESGSTTKGVSVMTYWGVDDVKKIYQRLLDSGASSLEEPHDVGGDIVVASVKDPWQNVIGVIFNPHFRQE